MKVSKRGVCVKEKPLLSNSISSEVRGTVDRFTTCSLSIDCISRLLLVLIPPFLTVPQLNPRGPQKGSRVDGCGVCTTATGAAKFVIGSDIFGAICNEENNVEGNV